MRLKHAAYAGLLMLVTAIGGMGWYKLGVERADSARLRAQLVTGEVNPTTIEAEPKESQRPTPFPEEAIDAVASVDSAPSREIVTASSPDELPNGEVRSARLAQRRLNMQKSFPGVVEALELSEDQANQLLDLLAEDQGKLGARLSSIGFDGTMTAAAEEVLQSQDRELDYAVVTALGAGKLPQWQEYRQTRIARMQSVTLATELGQLGLPLTSDQQRSLTAVLIAEHKRQIQDQPASASGGGSTLSASQAREQAGRQMGESNRRVLSAAAAVLNPDQLAILKRKFDSQAALINASSQPR